jgi:hypothetical protein
VQYHRAASLLHRFNMLPPYAVAAGSRSPNILERCMHICIGISRTHCPRVAIMIGNAWRSGVWHSLLLRRLSALPRGCNVCRLQLTPDLHSAAAVSHPRQYVGFVLREHDAAWNVYNDGRRIVRALSRQRNGARRRALRWVRLRPVDIDVDRYVCVCVCVW